MRIKQQAGDVPHKESEVHYPNAVLPPWVWYTVFGVLFFFLIGLQGGGQRRQSAIVMTGLLVIGLLWTIIRRKTVHWISAVTCAVAVYFVLNAAAGLYARFGNLAADEFGKIFAAFCVFVLVLCLVRQAQLRTLAVAAAAVSAIFGLLSLDASALGVLSRGFFVLMDQGLGCTYRNLNTGYEAGIRITGVFSTPNMLAGFLAFGIFLSLYLVRSAKNRRSRLIGCLLIGSNGLSFLMAFSMGAMAMLALAVIVYLLAERKDRRLSLFLLLVETGIVLLMAAFPAFRGLGRQDIFGILPLLSALLAGLLLWGIQEGLEYHILTWIAGKQQAALALIGGILGVLVLYLILAFQITGGYSLAPGEILRRSVYPEPGTYALEVQSSGQAVVTIEAQNRVDTVMHTSTVLYNGPLENASFTVPEETEVVYLNFSSPEGAALEHVALSGGPVVKLGYRLLPAFVANRLQGLWANQNAIQRVAFFRDGLKIFAQRPLIGWGLGAVEGLVHEVQDFYYLSRYVHNHYIQVMAEMGVFGLVSFLFLTLAPAVALWHKRKEDEEIDPLLPALSACLAMAVFHAFSEVDWSMGPYQIMAFLVLGMIAVFTNRTLPEAQGKPVSLGVPAVLGLTCCVFAALLAGNVYAEHTYDAIKTGRLEQTPYSMTKLAKIDRYNWAQYKLDMAVNAAQSPKEEFASTAAQYAEDCRALRIHSMNQSLEQYVYLPMGRYEELFQASREGIPQAAATQGTWQEEFSLYETAFNSLRWNESPDFPWFAGQVRQTYEMLTAHNRERLEQIRLTDRNLQFLDQMLALETSGLEGEQAFGILSLCFDSAHTADTNSDGIPDRMIGATLTPVDEGWTLQANDTLRLPFFTSGAQAVLTLTCDNPAAFSSSSVNGVPAVLQPDGTAIFPLDGSGEYWLELSTCAPVTISGLRLTVE
ncbi:MAG: O-antigen ligase family protein [Oscillospiraceae bacterium]|nr:O-antigen ligase family protein [Oscillospiraceae bacterium]